MKHVLLLAALGACVDTTGGTTVTFDVAAAGTPDAFDAPGGYRVTLTRATLHVGALYFNRSVPSSGAQSTSCILPGIYAAEELAPLDLDALSPTPQPFPAPAHGTDDAVTTAELWLTGGDVNAPADPTVIADLAGTATRGAEAIAFTATITIGANRAIPSSDPAQPSLHPICKQRIVSPIAVDLHPVDGGTLVMRVDPARWFANVDFAGLPASGVIPDDNSIPAGQNLFSGLRSATGTYTFAFE